MCIRDRIKAAQGVVLAVPGCEGIQVKMGQCFQDLCRLAIMFSLKNFEVDLAVYADFAAYPENSREIVQEQAKKHQAMIRATLEESAEGGAYVDAHGIATAERIFQDVHSRV